MARGNDYPREFKRAHCEIKMEYRTAESFMEAYMMQVGKGGLFIQYDDPLPMGTEITVSFNLPGDPDVIMAKGRVVWRMENPHHDVFDIGMGIKFTDISATDRLKIDNFVKSHPGA